MQILHLTPASRPADEGSMQVMLQIALRPRSSAAEYRPLELEYLQLLGTTLAIKSAIER